MRLTRPFFHVILAIAVSAIGSSVYAQGVLLRATSATSEGMGGVAVANPVDSAGAMYQNPASIAGFHKSEMSFGMGIIMPHSSVSSTVSGIASGKTESTTGALPSPSMSMIWDRPCSKWTLGFAMGGVGGAATLYRQDPTNPVMGTSVRTSNVQILQMMPTASYDVTPNLSFGITPVISMGKLEINPSGIANHSGTHQTSIGTRYIWGGGLNLGMYYDPHNNFKYGFCVKSPQWIEDIMVYDGSGHAHSLDLDLPMIYSAGVSYDGFRNTILAMDVRYMDYGNTPGFESTGYDATGHFRGLGWKSIFVVAIGAEYKVNKNLKVRAGYCFNENPIPDANQMYNIPSPLAMQHSVHCGTSFMFARDWDISLAYTHAFENSGTGPMYNPVNGNPMAGSSVTNAARGDTILAGVTKRF